MSNELFEEIKRIKSIADIGLLYAKDQYDKERYSELQAITFNLLEKVSGYTTDELKVSFPATKDYPTAKVDIRGLAIDESDKILLVRESIDGKWSLPGGWADIGQTPKEVVIKEFKEETGLDVLPKTLLAVFDKKMHNHPPQPFYVYKMIFYCEILLSDISKGFDVLDADYFDINNLPPLSEDRILESQIKLLYKKVKENDLVTLFD
jgi:ADP-ribose pyrophosphatase YjhB (NUDIX family)